MPPKPDPKPQRMIKQQNFKLPIPLVEHLHEYAAKAVPRASLVAHVELAIQEYLERHDKQ